MHSTTLFRGVVENRGGVSWECRVEKGVVEHVVECLNRGGLSWRPVVERIMHSTTGGGGRGPHWVCTGCAHDTPACSPRQGGVVEHGRGVQRVLLMCMAALHGPFGLPRTLVLDKAEPPMENKTENFVVVLRATYAAERQIAKVTDGRFRVRLGDATP